MKPVAAVVEAGEEPAPKRARFSEEEADTVAVVMPSAALGDGSESGEDTD